MLAIRKTTKSWIRAAVAATMTATLIAGGLSAQEANPVGVGEVETAKPAPVFTSTFMVHVGVNHDSLQYQDGDELSLSIKCEEEAYIYVVYEQADGRKFLIFPNAVQPKNLVAARAEVQIPARDDGFRWVVTSPFGRERVRVIASKTPLKTLHDPGLAKNRFNRLPHEVDKGIRTELRDPNHRDQYAEDFVSIETHPKTKLDANNSSIPSVETPSADVPCGVANAERSPRRIGVFFGVGRYEYNSDVLAINSDGPGLDLASCEKDAVQLAQTLRELGKLDDVQVFTNERATRHNMELAVTQWLASQTQPGDTVVIYFFGHGTAVPDESGDEKDGLDELILPYDFVPPEAFESYYKAYKANTLSPEKLNRLASWVETIKGGGEKFGYARLAAATAVSDDLFGHWLQRLAGRRVVVILDSCFSGGFATQEKGAGGREQKFDFLDGELQRLKDIDQPETAAMTASTSIQSAMTLANGELGVMTHFLIQQLRKSSTTVTLEDSHQYCTKHMKDYFASLNEYLSVHGKPPVMPHQPTLTNHCSAAVVLKP